MTIKKAKKLLESLAKQSTGEVATALEMAMEALDAVAAQERAAILSYEKTELERRPLYDVLYVSEGNNPCIAAYYEVTHEVQSNGGGFVYRELQRTRPVYTGYPEMPSLTSADVALIRIASEYTRQLCWLAHENEKNKK